MFSATLATNRPKRGEHRAFFSVATECGKMLTKKLILDKGARTRTEEDIVVSALVILEFAKFLNIPDVKNIEEQLWLIFGCPGDIYEDVTGNARSNL